MEEGPVDSLWEVCCERWEQDFDARTLGQSGVTLLPNTDTRTLLSYSSGTHRQPNCPELHVSDTWPHLDYSYRTQDTPTVRVMLLGYYTEFYFPITFLGPLKHSKAILLGHSNSPDYSSQVTDFGHIYTGLLFSNSRVYSSQTFGQSWFSLQEKFYPGSPCFKQ